MLTTNTNMKQALVIAFFFAVAIVSAQTSYITCSGDIYLESGALDKYASPVIFTNGTFDNRAGTWTVKLELSTGIVSAASPIKKEYYIRFTKAQIDAYTGSGTGDTAKLQNALDQATKDYLLTVNPVITFTIY